MDVDDLSPALRATLGGDAARGLLAAFNATRQEWAAEVIDVSVDRFDRRLEREFAALLAELRTNHITARLEARELTDALNRETARCRLQLIRWSLALFIAQFVATALIVGGLLMSVD